jgi:hypothetical protein
MVSLAALATVRQKYEALASLLHEKAQRRWAAVEARALGRGGISIVAAATGLSRPTIHRGLAELNSPSDALEDTDPRRTRIRRTGGGRHRLTTSDRSLLKDLQLGWTPLSRPKYGDPSLQSHQALRALVLRHADAEASSLSVRSKFFCL